jgi:hypothetical protein
MKKSLTALFILGTLFVLNSCKSREKCPAYGNKAVHSAQKPS